MSRWKLGPGGVTYQQWTVLADAVDGSAPLCGEDLVALYLRLLDAAPPHPITPERLAEMRHSVRRWTCGNERPEPGTVRNLAEMVHELLHVIGELRE